MLGKPPMVASMFEVGGQSEKNTFTPTMRQAQNIQPRKPQKNNIVEEAIHDSRARIKAIKRSLNIVHAKQMSKKRKIYKTKQFYLKASKH